MIFETHAHYEDEQFDEDREELLKKFPESGLDYYWEPYDKELQKKAFTMQA